KNSGDYFKMRAPLPPGKSGVARADVSAALATRRDVIEVALRPGLAVAAVRQLVVGYLDPVVQCGAGGDLTLHQGGVPTGGFGDVVELADGRIACCSYTSLHVWDGRQSVVTYWMPGGGGRRPNLGRLIALPDGRLASAAGVALCLWAVPGEPPGGPPPVTVA